MNKKLLFAMAFICCYCVKGSAQRVGISSNLLDLVTLSPNLGVEIAIGRKSTLFFNASIAPWKIKENLSFRHITLAPEYKYYIKQAFHSHFIGINALYSTYGLVFRKHRYEGTVAGLGLSYGYCFVVGQHWNIIPSIGLGAGINTDYINYKTRLIPTIPQFGINLQYIIR